MVKALKKNTKLSELLKLDSKHPGILTTFWREYSSNANFVQWLDDMEKKDPDWESYKDNLSDIEPEEPEDNIIENEELSVTEKIKLIREKYDNID